MGKHVAKLFTNSWNSWDWRIRILLSLKNIPYEYETVKQSGPEYMAFKERVNPTGSLPCLWIDNNLFIQTVAIAEYLDETRTEKYPLLPKDPFDKAKVRELCEFVNSNMSPYQSYLVQEYVKEKFNIDPYSWCNHFNENGVRTLEMMLKKESGEYTFGDTINLSDVYFFPQMYRAYHHYGVKPEDYPLCTKVYNNLSEIKHFAETSPQNQPDYEPFGV